MVSNSDLELADAIGVDTDEAPHPLLVAPVCNGEGEAILRQEERERE